MATQTQTVQRNSVRSSRVYDYLYGKVFLSNVLRNLTLSTDEIPWCTSGASLCKQRFNHMVPQAQHMLEEDYAIQLYWNRLLP